MPPPPTTASAAVLATIQTHCSWRRLFHSAGCCTPVGEHDDPGKSYNWVAAVGWASVPE